MLAGEHRFLEQADRLIAAIAPQAVENLYMHMALLNAVDLRLRAAEIVVTGEGARRRLCWQPRARIRRSTASCCTPVRSRRCRRNTRRGRRSPPPSEPAAFVCIGETCSLPVTDPAGLTAAIDAVRHS